MTNNIGLKKKGRSLVLGFPYSPQLVEESKQLGTSKYDPETKTRKYSYYSVQRLVEFCEKNSLPVADDVYPILEAVDDFPEVELNKGGLRIRILPGKNFPKEISHNKTKDWINVPSLDMSKALEWAKINNLKIAPDVVEYVTSQFAREVKNYSRGTSLEAEPIDITGLISTPLPAQWVPAHVIKDNKKAILADEQGLGKTLESLMAARITGEESARIVIVCPDKMTLNWIAEMEQHFTKETFSPWIATSRKPSDIPEEVDTVLVGWAILSYWVDHLISWNPEMVITDEGHYGKAGKLTQRVEQEISMDDQGNIVNEKVKKKVGGSYRGSAKAKLIQSVGETGRALDLTGTPMPSRPTELLPALQALGIDGHFGDSHHYKLRYCDGKQKYIGQGRGPKRDGYVWDFSGASNLIELNSRLLSTGNYIRRSKKHLVESGLLPQKFVDGQTFYEQADAPQPIYVDGDPEVMKEYIEIEYGLTKELVQLARAYAQKMRVSINHPKVLSKIAVEGNKRKDALFQLRRLAGLAAIPPTKKLVQSYVDNKEKVLLIAHHRDVVDTYVEEFEGASKIQGAMTTKKIEEEKKVFNSAGFDSPVMVLALEAGKTGHTLCKQPDKTCAVVINAEQAYNPSDDHQAQDRIWRLGQNREVNVLNILVKGTVSTGIYQNRLKKTKIVNAVIDGLSPKVSDETEKSALGQMAINLTQKGLENEGQ